MRKRLVILSGPACVGKGPMKAAIDMFFPEIHYSDIPVIKSKESRPNGPRPGEEEQWKDPDFFRAAKDINILKTNARYLVGDCRGFPQALDLNKVKQNDAEVIFIEVYHTLGSKLKESGYLEGIDVTSVFVSPISELDILDLKWCGVNLSQYLTDLMFAKLIARSRFMNETLTQKTINDIITRAKDVNAELANAYKYSLVIVNRDGEGSTNWNRSPSSTFISKPEGDAMRATNALAAVLKGNLSTPHTEVWNENVMHDGNPTFATDEPNQRHLRKICFADSRPGEPGGGGIDNDFYADYDFYGTVDDALAEANRIRREVYGGDFVFWLA